MGWETPQRLRVQFKLLHVILRGSSFMPNPGNSINRRCFIRDTATATLGVAAGIELTTPQIGMGTANAAHTPEELAAIEKTRSYNPDMEYRRLGKTGLWISAVCLGGHWKRIDKVIGAKADLNPYEAPTDANIVPAFERNRKEVVYRCLEKGINYIDFAGDSEAEAYSKVLRGRREEVYLGYSHPASELRVPENRTAKKLLELFDAGLKRCGLDYVDLWRLMVLEKGDRHTQTEVDEMIQALVTAHKQGKCRFTGISTHDREWAKALIEKYPDVIQVLIFPYTADSRALPDDSLFATLKKFDVGTFGIKPFASNAIFQGDGSPDSPHAEADNRRARIVIRYILSNPAITAPIPGLISTRQVDNMAAAIKENRQLDAKESAELETIKHQMWAQMAPDYHWLKDWRYV
jgi:predicted aldo/keto reductase-like oxidoreductase